jgi:hypothetical protein
MCWWCPTGLFVALAILLYSGCSQLATHTFENGQRLVFVGTYTDGAAEGIYRLRLDERTGDLTPAGQVTPAPDLAFLAIHPNGRFLYRAPR